MPTVTQNSTQRQLVAASPEFLYDLVANVDQMRRIFTPVVHSAFLEQGNGTDRVERWTWEAQVDGVRSWRASRTLDHDAGRITFRHENPNPPLLEVRGEWSFQPAADGATEVTLRHEFTLDPGDEGADRTAAMLDRGAGMQLGRVKNFAEEYDQLGELEVSYEVCHVVDAPLEAVYDYFYDVGHWRERIPHCLNAERREDIPNLQVVVMDVQVPSGALHTTKQARVCFPNEKIMWRQLEGLPPLDEMLYGHMTFTQTPAGVEVRTGQTELLKPNGVAKRGWTLEEAKQHVAEVRGSRNLDAIRSAGDYLRRQG